MYGVFNVHDMAGGRIPFGKADIMIVPHSEIDQTKIRDTASDPPIEPYAR
jgi:hypothetical protein